MTPASLRSQAEALRHAGRAAEAVDLLLQALTLAPTEIDSYVQLGFALQALGLHSQAAEALRTPVLLEPGNLMAQGYLIHATQKAADWSSFDADLDALRTALAATPTSAEDVYGMPFALVGLPHTRAELRHAASLASRQISRGLRPLPPRQPVARERLRLGYLSADFHAHATAALLVDALECHDRRRFEVTLYSHGPDDGSPLARRIRAAAEHVVDVSALDLAATAARIRADEIDLLVDLKGHTAGSRLAALACRPAPVQATWLGFPGTSGAAYVDYVIGDRVVTPLSHAADYSEQIAQLPGCYQPQDRQRRPTAPPSRTAVGLRDDALVLLSANAPYKITPALWTCWMGLLQQLPEAQLWQLSGGEQADAHLRAAARCRPGRRAPGLCAAGGHGRPPRPTRRRRPRAGQLALQRPHHHQRRAGRRRAGGHAEERQLPGPGRCQHLACSGSDRLHRRRRGGLCRLRAGAGTRCASAAATA